MPAPSKLAVIALAVLSVGGEPSLRPSPAPAPRSLVAPEDCVTLRDGDLVFRAGRDLVSHIVLQQQERSRYSHVGIFVWHDARPYVVHAVPADEHGKGGVRLERLAQFVDAREAARVGFARPRGLTQSDRRSRLRAYALAQLGKPFDDAFVFSDDGELYCTELVVKALQHVGVDVRSILRAALPLHAEPIPLPDALSQWSGLDPVGVEVDAAANDSP